MRPMMYRGFRLTVLNNKTYSFRHEWRIEAITQTAKALMLRNRGKDRSLVMHDPTSSRCVEYALDRGRARINELHSPFWYRAWHYDVA